ncbi:radical SAM protein [Mangrovicella endophytica]|uniref:radical SAM protein n=1 Tax=Mangrovicella endophytica TaxID=2066697 RepID=UPI0018E432D4|nr:radical SAM protein [Mangrovicella endophytica]
MPSIHIVNPAATFVSYATSDALPDNDGRHWTFTANLAVTTVAAMVPAGWDIRITDEQIEPIDFEFATDFVAITGQITQRRRIAELAGIFRGLGRTVLIGGPFATLDPEFVRPHADILVTGELEELAPRLFADLEAGSWQPSYDGGRADIRLSPLPRWDLYPVDRAETGALQTTRGCPFDCEFCDVIQYQGRKQRHKTVEQVIAELDQLYAYGFRQTFLVDDNFTVHRQFARTTLQAFIEWNERHADDPMRFTTQASLDIARDDEMLALCAAAGLRVLFMGIETINDASLRETNKKQNLLMPTLDAVRKIASHGISMRASFIVGFDHDDASIFGHLYEFLQASPLLDLSVGALTASKATRLYARLKKEGRLLEGLWERPYAVNFMPARMSPEELSAGVRKLTEDLFAPAAVEQRMLNLIELYGPDPSVLKRRAGAGGARGRMALKLIAGISSRGPAEAQMVSNVLSAANRKPEALPAILSFFSSYAKVRHYMDREDAAGHSGEAARAAMPMAAVC